MEFDPKGILHEYLRSGREVMLWKLEGLSERLGISSRTVDNLLGHVYAKLGIAGRRELAETLGAARL